MSLNLFEIAAKITLDSHGFESGINKASGQADSLASKLSNGLGNAVKAGAAAMAAGAAAAGAALTKLISDSTQAYAQYEQAIGGVETLFGDDAAQVMADAQEAYITTGQSATEYMQNVVSTSAALIRSLGGDTKEAARLSNMALKDMADNANKMGTSIESLQNAYTGFSRGNFQMLDNLSLGFSGTKESMQELLDYAYELTGEAFDIDSYADIVEAIHAVQEAMEITGTTAEEASKTIAGSTAAMKSSWQNLVTGLATPGADMGQLVEQMVDTSMQAATNWLGAVGNAVDGVKALFSQIGPAIQEKWPEIQGMLGNIVGKIFGDNPLSGENLTKVATFGVNLVQGLFSKATEAIPSLIEGLFGECGFLSGENIGLLAGKGIDLVAGLFSDMPALFGKLAEITPGIIEGLITGFFSPENIESLVNCGFKIVETIFSGDTFNLLFSIAKGLVSGLTNAVNNLLRPLLGHDVFRTDDPTFGFYENFANSHEGYNQAAQAQADMTLLQAQMGTLGYTGDRLTTGDFTSAYNTYGAGSLLTPVTTVSDPLGYGDLKIPSGFVVNQTINVNGSGSSPQDVKRAAEKGLEAALRG